MPRFFIPPEQIQRNLFTLTGSEAWHAARVLRMKVGDSIDLFDGKDLSYQGRIESVTTERIEGVIENRQAGPEGPKLELVLGQALIKGHKWDWLLEKACEIGVAKIIPLVTARTVVKPAQSEARERWKRIVLAASKQCGRGEVMDIDAVSTVEDAFRQQSPETLSLIPWEKETTRTIRQACQGFSGSRAVLFIGPEGGWDTLEIDRAARYGIVPVRLGPTLLRSETAGLVAAALVLSEFGWYS